MKFGFLACFAVCFRCDAFQAASNKRLAAPLQAASVDDHVKTGRDAKRQLLGLIGTRGYLESVLADPDTKEPLRVTTPGVRFGGQQQRTNRKLDLQSTGNTYRGTSDTFVNLLEAVQDQAKEDKTLARRLLPFIPPPLRSPLKTAGFPVGDDYVPMRDLFTSPAVSFAYERGWRQNFATAGFPGPDKEAQMAMEYFAPAVAANTENNVLVDMSCATGLFTRRFAKSGNYDRVIGCDYSESMLTEARRRIQGDATLQQQLLSASKQKLDLVRCDVGRIPMKTNSVDAFHAGAAMHCWPELPLAASEIYRVLKPGGRYFATTFLSTWFGTLQASEGSANGPSRQAFQYFESTDQLRGLMLEGGFAPENVSIEVIQPAAVIIRCEK